MPAIRVLEAHNIYRKNLRYRGHVQVTAIGIHAPKTICYNLHISFFLMVINYVFLVNNLRVSNPMIRNPNIKTLCHEELIQSLSLFHLSQCIHRRSNGIGSAATYLFLESELPSETLLNISKNSSFHQPITTFILPSDAQDTDNTSWLYHIRWFSTITVVLICGHGILVLPLVSSSIKEGFVLRSGPELQGE